MKIWYRKSQNNEWSAKPSKDGVYLWRLLPDNPEQEKFCLLVNYFEGSGNYCLVARSDTSESVIADELNEQEARSLVLAYLKARDQLFAAAEQDAIERLIAAYSVEDHGLLVNQKNVQLRPADALSSLPDVAEKVRLYRLRRDDGLRIIAADHFYKTPTEVDPDLSVWEKAPERLPDASSQRGKKLLIWVGITAAAALLVWALMSPPNDSGPNPSEPSDPTTVSSGDGSDGANKGVINGGQGGAATNGTAASSDAEEEGQSTSSATQEESNQPSKPPTAEQPVDSDTATPQSIPPSQDVPNNENLKDLPQQPITAE